MNTKGILGISLAAAFAIGMTTLAYAGIDETYWVIDSAAVNAVEDDYVFSANMNGTVPVNSNKAEFNIPLPVWGVAWVDGTSTGSNFTAVTIHPEIVDSRQNPDHWHPHTGTFVNEGTLCVATLQSPHGGIDKDGEDITLTIPQKWSVVSDETAGGAASFFLLPNDNDCPPVEVDLPGKGLKPHQVSPPLPGLQVVPVNLVGLDG